MTLTDKAVRRSITIAELGVIISLICSVGSLLFTAGVVYGDVQRNTKDIDEMKPLGERVAKIEAGVEFLVEEKRKENQAR